MYYVNITENELTLQDKCNKRTNDQVTSLVRISNLVHAPIPYSPQDKGNKSATPHGEGQGQAPYQLWSTSL